MELQGAPNSQSDLEKNKVERHILLNFKTYYKVTVMKIVWYWHKKRYTNQWIRANSSETNSYIYGSLIFDSAQIIK